MQQRPSSPTSLTLAELNRLADQLSESPDFRVIRRLPAQLGKAPAALPDTARLGLIVDTETTGLDDSDKIIELGMVLFAYDSLSGTVYGVCDEYCGLEDPGVPIDEDSPAARVNGITNAMVAGQRLDDEKVLGLLELADIVIAHNSSFDRPKVEARYPQFAAAPWACSLHQVPWAELGYLSGKLEFLLQERGFFFEAHRASEDCHALLQLLAMPVPSGTDSHLKGLLAVALSTSYRLWAEGSPFATKDLLKSRGYRWSGGETPGSVKAWFIDIPDDAALKVEMAWLRDSVFRRDFSAPVHETDALSRFSVRHGRLTRAYSDK